MGITLRAWHKKHKVMYYMFQNELAYDNGEWADVLDWHEVMSGKNKDIVLLQDTGLKDNKGNKVFQGDIVQLSEVLKVKNVITDIYYECSAFRYRHRDGSGSLIPRQSPNRIGDPELEVIGNIYENPELLEKT